MAAHRTRTSTRLGFSIADAVELAVRSSSSVLESWRVGECKPWSSNAREKQRPPAGDLEWFLWLMRTGRGFGKTYALSGNGIDLVKSGQWRRFAVVAPTQGDVRKTMIEGEAGLLAMAEAEGVGAEYYSSLGKVVFSTGAEAHTYSDEKPGRIRGGSFDGALCDELREWRNGPETWDNLIRALRLGERPQVIAATTPPDALSKRPVSLAVLRWLRKLEDESFTVTTTGSSTENLENLSPTYRQITIDPYVGTRLGRREVEGEYVDDIEGALWTTELLDETRLTPVQMNGRDLVRVAVGVDPPGGAVECGIVGAGVSADLEGFVLEDGSIRSTPEVWSREVARVVEAIRADRVIGEVNYGGDMVKAVLGVAQPNLSFKAVRATRGKAVRAEPVAALWETGKGHLVGHFPELEEEMCSWTPESPVSPNRLDALVWAMTHLVIERRPILFGRS
jgi:phage terminase large subunit-like protein